MAFQKAAASVAGPYQAHMEGRLSRGSVDGPCARLGVGMVAWAAPGAPRVRRRARNLGAGATRWVKPGLPIARVRSPVDGDVTAFVVAGRPRPWTDTHTNTHGTRRNSGTTRSGSPRSRCT